LKIGLCGNLGKTGLNVLAGVLLFFSGPPECPAFDNTRLFSDAEGGDREAQYTLAHQYLKGRGGLAKDPDRARYWFGRAADGGHQDGAFNLAILYLEGTAVDKDLNGAVYRMEQAAENGHREAQYMLGMAHWQGDPRKASKWLAGAAETGHPEAAEKLEQLCSKYQSFQSCRENGY
jgi:TPR repeat protein